jgi:mannose-1-phosphate guanylyltransferase
VVADAGSDAGAGADAPVVAVVLAGGTGSRLYPASRAARPKQFLPLLGTESLLERTVDRAAFADHVVVSTRPALEADVRDLVPDAAVVVEPAGKDTGPAVAYATHRVGERYGDDSVVVVLPSDHAVGDDAAAAETLRRGAAVARETGRLVAFGVEPTRPETGYGYVEPGADRGGYADLRSFHEKPDAATAERYVEAGYLWNAGLFAWTVGAFRAAARDTPLGPLLDALDRGDVAAGFDAVAPTSVDYAVMERVDDAAVVPLDVAWDDLGSWDALARLLPADADGNVVHAGTGTASADAAARAPTGVDAADGDAEADADDADDAADGDAEADADDAADGAGKDDALFVDSADNVVVSDGPHVSLVGVDGLAVVVWDDRVLVVPTAEAQRVREVVSALTEQGRF